MAYDSQQAVDKNLTEANHDMKSAPIPTESVNVYKVMKRDGKFVDFDRSKIETALLKCYSDPKVYGEQVRNSSSVHDKIRIITDGIMAKIEKMSRATIVIEEIQDLVEEGLMDAKEYKAAREYINFREKRAMHREATEPVKKINIHITGKNGQKYPLDERALLRLCTEAAEGLKFVDPEMVKNRIIKDLYDGATEKELDQALTMASSVFIENEPEYTYMTARLLLSGTRREVFGILGIAADDSQRSMSSVYGQVFRRSLEHGVKINIIDPKLLQRFDLERLGKAIELNAFNDFKFDYVGLKTLYDRYFIHDKGTRIELPQTFLMRVAMGLSIEEKNPTEIALEFYQQLSSFDSMQSTPTLFNSGTLRPQMSSCFLTSVPDDLFGIFKAVQDNAMLSKFAGGLGNDWTPVRAIGARIKGTNGKSSGTVPFMKVMNDTAVAVNQGGKRKGAVCAYLETWHRDIEEFLDLRKNTGDDRRRTHDMNTANWIPDLFMKRVIQEGNWSLFSPDEVPELHDLVGEAFEAKYVEYEAKGKKGELDVYKEIKALDLWRKMLSMLFETGHPWITFKDPCNIRSPQQHVGVVHSSNLCTEITLNTIPNEEIAVCNLGSINAPAHVDLTTRKIDFAKLRKTVRTSMRMLDNVIDINHYTVDTARNANLRHRPVGLGIMGFQDVLYKLRVSYESEEAVQISDEFAEAVSYYAIEASADLAQERGSYESFEGSLWSKGILPLDSQELLLNQRGVSYFDINRSTSGVFDWNALREKVKKGMRNSNTQAIAPTATISNIIGVTQSIEPTYQHIYAESNMSGNFTAINSYLVNDLKDLGLWDLAMVHDIKHFDGILDKISRIPENLKTLYKTSFEIKPEFLIRCAARRQKWIDQGQSLNLYMAKPNGRALDAMYKQAWKAGLKTTYYLRSLGATNTEKTSIDTRQLNQVKVDSSDTSVVVGKVCDINAGPECEACQ